MAEPFKDPEREQMRRFLEEQLGGTGAAPQGQSPVKVPAAPPGQPGILPPIQAPQALTPAITQDSMPIELKLLNNMTLTPEELDRLAQEGMPYGQPLAAAGEFIQTIISPQSLAFGIDIASQSAGTALGDLVGQPMLGASVGAVAGTAINQALGFENPSFGNYVVAALGPPTIDALADIGRAGVRRFAGATKVGRQVRGTQTASYLNPHSFDAFAPELAKEINTAADRVIRTRAFYQQAENRAFQSVRNSGLTIDLEPVAQTIFDQAQVKSDTRNAILRAFQRREPAGQKYADLIAPYMPVKSGQTPPILPLGRSLYDGEQLLSFRQRLSDLRDTIATRGGTTAREQLQDIGRIQRVLEQTIDNAADSLDTIPGQDPGLPQLLRRANRISQMRIAHDEWADLLARHSRSYNVGKYSAPEFDLEGIDTAVRTARQRIAQNRPGTDLDTFVRMTDKLPGGWDSWEELMRAVRKLSPGNNPTIFQAGERTGALTNTTAAASRLLWLQAMNQAILHPVARKVLADTFYMQGHTGLTRRTLAMALTVARGYSNLSEIDHVDAEFIQLLNKLGSQVGDYINQARASYAFPLNNPLKPLFAGPASAYTAAARPPDPIALGPQDVNLPPAPPRQKRGQTFREVLNPEAIINLYQALGRGSVSEVPPEQYSARQGRPPGKFRANPPLFGP